MDNFKVKKLKSINFHNHIPMKPKISHLFHIDFTVEKKIIDKQFCCLFLKKKRTKFN